MDSDFAAPARLLPLGAAPTRFAAAAVFRAAAAADDSAAGAREPGERVADRIGRRFVIRNSTAALTVLL